MIGYLRKALKRTPLAWLQVSYNPVKLAIGLAGVGFSNLLMFFQLGLMDSLYNSQKKPIEHLQADLVMVSSEYSNLGSLQDFPRSRLYQVLGVPGVAAVSPLRIARGTWITPSTRKSYDVYVYGVNLAQPSLSFPEIEDNRSSLQVLRHAERPARIDRNHLVDAVAKDEATVHDADLRVGQSGEFAVEVAGQVEEVGVHAPDFRSAPTFGFVLILRTPRR